ncbi:MAG: TolC family protein [Candidatus Dadabacteria bacterium]|nr:MAG: TolC family protein [Candidatus Dadabacteria bacterium]
MKAFICAIMLVVASEAVAQPSSEYKRHVSVVHPQRDLQELVEIALRENPSLKDLEAQIEALKQQVIQAGTWKNPTLSTAYMNAPVDSFNLNEFGMSGIEIKLSQTVPFLGKTSLRKKVAANRVKEKKWALLEKQATLKTLVRKAYYSLSLTRQLRNITQKHIQLISQFLTSIKYKYEAGKAGQHDLLRLKILKDELVDNLEDFDRQEDSLSAAINAALHRPVDTPVKTDLTLKAHNVPLKFEALYSQALESRPLVKQLQEEIKTYQAAAKLSRYEAIPDITTFVSYRYRERVAGKDDGTDFATVGFSVPLPLFYSSTFGAQASEKAAKARAAGARLEELKDQIASGIKRTLATLNRAYSKAETYRTRLLPDAKTTLDATFSAYQVDRADFASFYQAELKLLEFDRALRHAQATTHIAIAELESLIGEDF